MDGSASAVGWNWKNSRSATATPARSAMATPSPVASRGLVVTSNSWPAPPVARSTLRARTCSNPSGPMDVTPTQRPSSINRSSAKACSCTTAAVRRTAWTSARSTSAPVAAPACTTRATEWPPSRARSRLPRSSRSNSAPSAMSSSTRRGPSSTSTRTASRSHSPAPAARVSARCRSTSSGSSVSAAATPPWAQRVVVCSNSPLVSTPVTRSWAPAARTAADSPATPLPSTSRSSTSVGHGVGSRRHVVDESGAPEPHRTEQAVRWSGHPDRLEGVGVDDVDVVECAEGGVVDHRPHQRADGVGIGLAPGDGGGPGGKRPRQDRGDRPFLGRQVDVAAGHGQAVGLAVGRASHDQRRGTTGRPPCGARWSAVGSPSRRSRRDTARRC